MISWPTWKTSTLARFLCIAVTGSLLVIVFDKINYNLLATTLFQVRWPWFLAGIFAFAFALFAASWRIHQAFGLTGLVVHHLATIKSVWIGHFFYTVYFGGVGGDTARSALYARWYHFPFGHVLATSPLDRLFGLLGLFLLAAAAALPRLFGDNVKIPIHLDFKWTWVIGTGLILILILGLRPWRFQKIPWLQQGWTTLVEGLKRLAHSPGIMVRGATAGFLVHVGLSSVLALNLQALSRVEIPWMQLLWTFPAIFIISAFPLTVAGLGLREGAAVALLGIYGIPATDAVAAALLSLPATLICALAGGTILLREERLFSQQANRPTAKTLSVVIPALNEAEALPATLARIQAVPEVLETIVVDGGSQDETPRVAKKFGCRVIHGPPGRGAQLRAGASEAKGDVILLLHADTWLSPNAGKAVLDALRDRTLAGGGFWKVFHQPSILMRGSRLKCAIRFYLGRRIMGDQGMFVRREILESIDGVPALPLMEEFELCRRLREKGALTLASSTVITSARRFHTEGVLRTYWKMWVITTRYYLGTSPEDLRNLYERK